MTGISAAEENRRIGQYLISVFIALLTMLVVASAMAWWTGQGMYERTIFGPGQPTPTPFIYPTLTPRPTVTPEPGAFQMSCQPIQYAGDAQRYQVCILPDGSECIFDQWENGGRPVMCKGWSSQEMKTK
jgi:hypothetical protein